MRIENLVKRFNETTIKDDVYGAMSNIEDIKEAFGLDINIQEETQYFQLEDGRYITFDFDFKANSIWVYIDLYEADEYEPEIEEEFEEDDDYELEDDEEE